MALLKNKLLFLEKRMKKAANTFTPELYKPIKKEMLTPVEFKSILESSPSRIKKTRFIPPSPSKKGFGFFEVEYTVPILRHFNRGVACE